MREIKLTVHGDTVHASQYLAGVRGSANATTLVVAFDEGWDGYAKQIVFWDALDQNPVTRILTADLLVEPANDTRTYRTAIPGEALAVAGECMLVIEGWRDNTRLRAMQLRLVVEYAPHTEPADPTPDQFSQMQGQYEEIIGVIQNAHQSAEEAENFRADAQTAAGQAAQYAANALASEIAAQQHKENANISAQEAEKHQAAAEDAAKQAEGYTSHPPIIGENGNWWEWDGEAYADTGKPSQGEIGPQGEQGPQGVQGPRGAQGERGPSGVYVGSGDMPEECNVQIDEGGDSVTMESLVEAVLAEMGPAIGEIETALSRITDLQESYMSTAELDRIIAQEEACIGGDG